MFFAATSSVILLSLITILSVMTIQNIEMIEVALIELIFIGRIPGTEMYISYEALAAGVVFGIWMILTYKFYSACISKIATGLKPDEQRLQAIEEIAL